MHLLSREPKLRVTDNSRMLRGRGRPSRTPQASSTSVSDEQLDRLDAIERAQTERINTLERTQWATLEALSELSSAVRALKETVEEKTILAQDNKAITIEPGEEEVRNEEDGLDRKQVRLDGLEVYAVVSAVTAGTLVAVFDGYQSDDIGDMFHEGRYLEVVMGVAFLVTGTIGIVCGLHCIFVFSLITMYGRTAIGMERDDALEEFFAGTGMQRFRGFQSFVRSLYALMGELIVVVTSKVSKRPGVHLIALCVTVTLMYYVYRDTQVIMDKAGVIFAPRPVPRPVPPPVQSREGKVGEDEEKKSDAAPCRSRRSMLLKGQSSFNLAATALLRNDSDEDEADEQELLEKKGAPQRLRRITATQNRKSSFTPSEDDIAEESSDTEDSPPLTLRQRPGFSRNIKEENITAHAKRGGRPRMEKRFSSMSVAAVDLFDKDD